MSTEQKTLGQAIDEIVAALSPLDERARSTAIGAACAHLGVPRSSGHPAAAFSLVPGQTQPPESLPVPSIQDIRTLFGTPGELQEGTPGTPC